MKKFLSLVLALVMTMSLVTVSAGAKDFTDASKITYDEAVDVMSAAKVIDGYAEGDFRPSTTLTRGAAAKIICNLILGPTTASALVADAAPYKDVPTNHTFAGYIAYCQKEGIISGYADGTFRPANTLTGYAFMKMLLGALGYDAATEGYTGPNWSIQVAKRALNIGLDDDLTGSFNGVKAVNREEACLYAFNTLKATMVEYENNNSVTVNGITFTNKSTAKDMVNNAKVETIKDDNKMQFAEKYFDKLSISTKAADKIDDFGRPATTWIYDKDTVGTYADSADESIVLNKNMTANAALITDSDYLNYSDKDVASNVTVYINGAEQSDKKTALSKVDLKAGDQIEVFENDDNEAETVAVIRYQLAKIDEVESKLSNTYTKQGATYSITLKDLNDQGIGGTYYDVYDADSDKELTGFDADTYKADTVLAVAMKGNVVLASNVADSTSGKITAYNTGSKANITLDGNKYALHATVNMSNTGDVDYQKASFNLDDSTYTVYTDKNGYVIGIDETEATKIDDVYYVTEVGYDSGRYGTNTYYAQAVSLKDGSVTEFKLKDTAKNAATLGVDFKDTDRQMVGKLFSFDKDGSKYTAKAYTGDGTYSIVANAGAAVAISDKLQKDDTKMTLVGANITTEGKTKANTGKFYLNDKTQYIKVESTGDDIGTKFVTGGTSVVDTWTDKSVTPNKTYPTTAIAVVTKNSNNYVASYVILISGSFSNAGSDNVVYVKEKSNTTVSYKTADGDTKTGYSTELYFLDGSGKTDTVIVNAQEENGFYTYDINDDGVYELTDNVKPLTVAGSSYDDETGYVEDAKLTGVYNNALSISAVGGKTMDDVDFASNVIVRDNRNKDDRDADLYTSEITTVSQLKSAVDKKNSNVVADVYYDDGEVIMVYVWSMANADGKGQDNDPTVSYKMDAWTTLSNADPSGNVNVVICKTENGVDTWLTQADLVKLGLTVGNFEVTTGSNTYAPVKPDSGATMKYFTCDASNCGNAALVSANAGFIKVHFDVDTLANGSTISIPSMDLSCKIVVG